MLTVVGQLYYSIRTNYVHIMSNTPGHSQQINVKFKFNQNNKTLKLIIREKRDCCVFVTEKKESTDI